MDLFVWIFFNRGKRSHLFRCVCVSTFVCLWVHELKLVCEHCDKNHRLVLDLLSRWLLVLQSVVLTQFLWSPPFWTNLYRQSWQKPGIRFQLLHKHLMVVRLGSRRPFILSHSDDVPSLIPASAYLNMLHLSKYPMYVWKEEWPSIVSTHIIFSGVSWIHFQGL